MHRQVLNEEDLEILDSCKTQMKIHINALLDRNVRPTNIEIELYHYMINLIKKEKEKRQ